MIAYEVHAFTYKQHGGNPAGVVIVDRKLSEKEMQQIAFYLGFSETAFVKKSDCEDYDYHVRFFTPVAEVDLCGHATIATFHLLNHLGQLNKSTLKQKTKAGILDVIIHDDGKTIFMEQSHPDRFPEVPYDRQHISKILRIDEELIGLEQASVDAAVYSTGLKDLLLPVKDMDALNAIKPNFNKMQEYTDENELVGIHVFTLHDGNIHCRNFAPSYGILEEAATGTSNGALCAYLYDNNLLLSDGIVAYQGEKMRMTSKISASIVHEHSPYGVLVGGECTVKNTLEVRGYHD